MLRKQGHKRVSIRLGSTYFFCCLLGLFSSALAAQDRQDLEDLQAQAKQWVEEQLATSSQDFNVSLRPLDPSLRLASCTEPLSFAQHGSGELRGRSNIRVTCQSQDWFIFITAEVQVFAPVLVAKASLTRGMTLDESLVEIKQMDISRIRGDYFTRPDTVAGMQVRNRIRPGQIITPRQLNSVQAVSRGDQVIIRARSNSLTLRMTGEALEAGNLGEQIRVRNLQSNRTIHARIVEQGLVEVRL